MKKHKLLIAVITFGLTWVGRTNPNFSNDFKQEKIRERPTVVYEHGFSIVPG